MKKNTENILILIIIIIILLVIAKSVFPYPNDTAPSFDVYNNSIIVISNQKDIIRFRKSIIKYRIKEDGRDYGEWQNSNKFSNLKGNVYFVQTSIVNSKNTYFISKEIEVHMYKGDLVDLDGTIAATEKGLLYTIPYYCFEQQYSYTEECPNSGKKAGAWGDSDLKKECPLCGTKNITRRGDPSEREEYVTWNGRKAHRDIYIYEDHYRKKYITEYNYSFDENGGKGKLFKTYYIKETQE